MILKHDVMLCGKERGRGREKGEREGERGGIRQFDKVSQFLIG